MYKTTYIKCIQFGKLNKNDYFFYCFLYLILKKPYKKKEKCTRMRPEAVCEVVARFGACVDTREVAATDEVAATIWNFRPNVNNPEQP